MTPNIRTLYLAGPMTGHPQFNFPTFRDAAERLRQHGYTVINPAEEDDPAVQEAAWASPTGDPADLNGLYGIGACPIPTALSNVEQVASADAVALLDGWQKSSGASHEVETANRFGLPVAPAWLWCQAAMSQCITRQPVTAADVADVLHKATT
jgi:hypothetical protein